MARPLRIEYEGAFYHVIARGNESKEIFKDNHDREKFLDYLKQQVMKYGVTVHSYCLMNNHYHLIIETPEGNLSKAMQFLQTSYSVYYNNRNERKGHLFQGRYKAKLVQVDVYLQQLSRYIHLNPERAKMIKNGEDYKWSSCQYYVGKKKAPGWLKVDFILDMFSKGKENAYRNYKEFIRLEQITYAKVLKEIRDNVILGDDKFQEMIKQEYLLGQKDNKEITGLKKVIGNQVCPSKIKTEVDKKLQDVRLTRKIKIYLMRKYTQKGLKEIGEEFGGVSYSAISQVYRRIEKKRKRDNSLDLLIQGIEKSLNVKI